jgi:serine/threonine protein kinase
VTPELPLVGEDFAGYRLRAVSGRGGMSVVYEAENLRLGNTVALKVLAPELSSDDVFRARFLKESRIAASLTHPNVIPIYDSGPHEGLLFIAMRYVGGSDLRTVLQMHDHLSPSQALLLIGQAGRALDAAHRLGLVHRDVKPANILIEPGTDDDPDHVYLADFGITKHTLSRSGLTATGQFVGTIDYIAPEQIRDKSVDGRADIYSLGCVLYECLTGRVPFVKDLDAAVIWAHVEESPTPPSTIKPELPSKIDEVISRALAKDPDERHQSCRELIRDAHAALEPVLQATETTAPGIGVQVGPPTVLSGRSGQPETSRTPSAHGSTNPPAGSPSVPSLPPLANPAIPGKPSPPTEQPPGHQDSPPARGNRRWPVVIGMGIAALVIAGIVAWALSRGSGAKHPTPLVGEARAATLAAVPTNHVHGAGSATLRLNGQVATVTVKAHGLLNDAPHLMHIHAGGLGICPPASAARLHNGHLAISTVDGIHFYGPVEASLTTRGDASNGSYLAFSRVPKTGNIKYARTIHVSRSLAKKIRANNAVVVIHGIDYDGSGIYDNVLSNSELLPTAPGDATAPALCGPLVAAPTTTASAARRGGLSPGETYTASLSVATNAFSLWCEAAGVASATVTARESYSRRVSGQA